MGPAGGEALQVGLLTPLGPAGITVVQLAGTGAGELLEGLVRDRKGRELELAGSEGKIQRAYIVDSEGRRIDEVLLASHALEELCCQAIDICCHGGVRPAQKVMELLVLAGAQPVQGRQLPGGGLAGLIDITGDSYNGVAAEALGQLCRASTEQVVRILLGQIEAGLSEELQGLLAPALTVEQLGKGIDRLLASWNLGRRLISPAKVTIVGPVNAGKSSLANLLTGQTGSIVTARPGTTRDWVTQQVSLAGLPVILIDTAGHRPPADALEAEAIRRAIQQSWDADLQLLVIDGASPVADLPELPAGLRTVVAVNKADLEGWSFDSVPQQFKDCVWVKTSALTGWGQQELSTALLQGLDCQAIGQTGPVVFTERQKECLERASRALQSNGELDLRAARQGLCECLHGP